MQWQWVVLMQVQQWKHAQKKPRKRKYIHKFRSIHPMNFPAMHQLHIYSTVSLSLTPPSQCISQILQSRSRKILKDIPQTQGKSLGCWNEISYRLNTVHTVQPIMTMYRRQAHNSSLCAVVNECQMSPLTKLLLLLLLLVHWHLTHARSHISHGASVCIIYLPWHHSWWNNVVIDIFHKIFISY